TVFVFAESRNCAVVDDVALVIAPAAVDDLIDRYFVDVARDDAIHEARGIGTGDAVFVERRDVDERGRIADSVVLVLVMHLVHATRVVTGPLAIVEAFAESESSFVKCRADGHEASGGEGGL